MFGGQEFLAFLTLSCSGGLGNLMGPQTGLFDGKI